jgi:hypothetical protein
MSESAQQPPFDVNPPLLALFQGHGVEAVAEGEWVTFPGRAHRACAVIVKETPHKASLSVQLDVRFEVAPGRTVVESFAGVGVTREEAVKDAIRNFTMNSFHVLLAAFLVPGDDEQVGREEWTVGGRPSRVTVGNVGIRGRPPVSGAAVVAWYHVFEERIKEKQLRPGTHWVRLYYGQMDNKPLACEVLLDNRVWDEVQSEMVAYDWPCGEAFYSVRVFLVLEVGTDGTVTPETAVQWFAEMIAEREAFTEEEAYTLLTEAGVPPALADRTYKFTQVAWGRVFLDGLGVQFSPEYVCFNAAGEVIESGALADEPSFAAATRLGELYRTAPGFLRLALTSAGVHAINSALNKGSKPEDLATAPAFLFLEAPTDAGMANAQKAINQYVAAIPRRPK